MRNTPTQQDFEMKLTMGTKGLSIQTVPQCANLEACQSNEQIEEISDASRAMTVSDW